MTREKTYIYSLSCPENGIVRYIGKANNLKNRLSKHINGKDCSRRYNWILSLKRKGLIPEMNIIDEVPYCDWQFWEKHYIKLYKSFGADLVNGNDGGAGAEPTVASIEKWKKSISGRPFVMTQARIDANNRRKESNWEPWNKGKMYTRNISKEESEKRSKSQVGKHGGKPVAQYDLDGNLIKIWPNAYRIEKESGINITFQDVSACCIGKTKHAKGYMWKFTTGNPSIKIPKCDGIVKGKPVYQKDLDGNLIKKWDSCAVIVKELGYDMRTISAKCLGIGGGKYNNSIWSYKL